MQALETKVKTKIYDVDKNRSLNTFDEVLQQELIFVCVPTPMKVDGSCDLSILEKLFEDISNKDLDFQEEHTFIIKSTVPIGFTKSQSLKWNTNRIIFSPEFLREGKAIHDNLYPSRLIIGGEENQKNTSYSKIMLDAAIDKEFKILYMSSSEAEAVKLFSNAFLAMRVAFFNELDSFAMDQQMNTFNVIRGVSLDSRIGDYYNNPSFGFGGYCLPKDTKQLLSHYDGIPQSLVEAIIKSNTTRKDFLVNKIKSINPGTIGIYRLIMKEGSDNFRESAVLTFIHKLLQNNFNIILYEPMINDNFYEKIPLKNNLQDFIDSSDLIVANRSSSDLNNCEHKVFTRDLFHRDT